MTAAGKIERENPSRWWLAPAQRRENQKAMLVSPGNATIASARRGMRSRVLDVKGSSDRSRDCRTDGVRLQAGAAMAQREGGVPIRLVLREQMRNAAHG